jgi:hypothetical protein
MQKFVQWCRIRILSNDRTRFTQLDPKLMFCRVSDRLVTQRTSVQNGQTGAIYTQVRATKSRQNFMQRADPIHPVWPQPHVLGVSKRFVTPRTEVQTGRTSRNGIYRNERTRSTPLDPKLMFWVFRSVLLLCELGWKMDQTGAIIAKVRATNSRRNFSQRTHPSHPIGSQTHVLGRFGPFHYNTNLGAKRAELKQLMHKFLQRTGIGIFRNERTRSTPLDPKLIFWGVSHRFVMAQTSMQNGLNGCH